MPVEQWFRSFHGAPTDPKWIIIAKRAGVTPGMVAAIWWALLDHASQATPRGCVARFDLEAVSAFFGWDETQCNAVLVTLRERGMIDADGMLSAWLKRNPKREDDSAERVRKYRERKRLEDEAGSGNAVKRSVTHGNAREEERREEESREEKDVKKAPSGPKKAGGVKRALPDDWRPTDAHRVLASKRGIDMAAEAEKMRDWALANGERKIDWDATFRNWLRNARSSSNGATHSGGATEYLPAPPKDEARQQLTPKGARVVDGLIRNAK